MTWPVTPEAVRGFVGSTQTGDDQGLVLAVAAVNAYVPKIPALATLWVVPEGETDPVFTPGADVEWGAVMLAARLHARRGATLGMVTGYQDFAGMVVRFDPDVARMLKIGSASGGFVFGAPTPAVVDDPVVVP